MNLREAGDSKGFPTRDDIPATILTGNFKDVESYTLTCHAFFAAIFTCLKKELSKGDANNFIKQWNDRMTTLGESNCTIQRLQFFQEVRNIYENVSLLIPIKQHCFLFHQGTYGYSGWIRRVKWVHCIDFCA